MISCVSINRARPTMHKILHHGIFVAASNESDAELMQYLFPVGWGPSLNTWPRCAPQLAQDTSVLFQPETQGNKISKRYKLVIWESLSQFENRSMPLVYGRRITRSTMYQKSSILLAGNGTVKISSVACGFSPVKIDYSDYPKSFISRINEDHVFFNKISLKGLLHGMGN